MIDIDLPEVQSFAQQPRFFKEGTKDFVEISFLGSKDTLVKRVTPELMARFRAEWDAYCDGRPMEKRKGTPLTDLPEIKEQMAEEFVRRNLHTLEELAVLNDHQCQALGHGMITLRKKAQALVAMRAMQERDHNHKIISESVAAVKPDPVADKELSELKQVVAEQAKKIDALVDVMTKLAEQNAPRKPGRPRKTDDGSQFNS